MHDSSTPLDSKTSALIWFGAAVSIAEILTGTLFAPLGFAQGLTAIVLGHLIGGGLFFAAGYIGAQTGKSAMQTTALSFGHHGSFLFSLANIIQLVGWTAIMIITGAQAAAALSGGGETVWSIAIGLLILVWLFIGMRNFDKINLAAMSALFLLTLWWSGSAFHGQAPAAAPAADGISFGAAVELAVAMPLSWLPLVADYTRRAKRPLAATLSGTLAYSLTSCWMYAIGLGAALFSQQSDIAAMLQHTGLGLAGIFIVVFSTVTTTFLDAHSAGVSSQHLFQQLKERPTAIAVTLLGTLLAIVYPVHQFENFLYFIGSVFAPMIAIQIADFFLLKRRQQPATIDWVALALWLAGFILYRNLLQWETPVGSTLPVMAAVVILTLLARKIFNRAAEN